MVCPACGTPNEGIAESCFGCGRSLYSLTKGEVLSERYEILSLLGKGGMGMVYKAHDRELDEVVAIKILRPDIAQSAEMAKRFRSEIKLARKVRHKNVCGIHEYGQDRHLRYIAMEYVEGTDLKTLLRSKGPLPPEEAFDAAVQVASGLHAVHEVGIVHRDLKTPNLMRDGRGAIRLMDFGIAKSFDADGTTGATLTGQIVGTPEYMSPEQVRGERIDARSDIYALGIVAYELFTGGVPFHGDTPAATLMKHLNEPFTLEGTPAAKLPAAVVPVLRKALAKDRAERYASAEEMAEALRAARHETSADPVRAFATPPTIVWSPPATGTAVDNETPDEDIEFEPPTRTPAPKTPPPPAKVETPPPAPLADTKPVPTPIPTPPPPVVRPATPAPPPVAVTPPRPVQIPVRVSTPMPAPPAAPTPPSARPAVPERIVGSAVPVQRPATPPPRTPSTVIVPPTPTPTRAPAPRKRTGLLVGLVSVPLIVVLGLVVYRATAPSPTEPSPSPVPSLAAPTPAASPPIVSVTTLAAAVTTAETLVLHAPEKRPTAAPSASTPQPRAILPTPALSPPATQAAAPPPSMAPVVTEPPLTTVATQPPALTEHVATQPTMPPAPGSLRVRVVPSAEVVVDGRPSGRASSMEVRLTPGKHLVVFRHPGFEPLRRVVIVRSGETTDLAVDLRDEAIKRK